MPPELPNRVFWAWDAANRVAYVTATIRQLDAAGDTVQKIAAFYKFTRATNTWTMLTGPPVTAALQPQLDDFSIRMVWDSVNSRVLYPVTLDPCAQVQQMLVYNPSSSAWQSVPLPATLDVRAGTLAFDPSRNVAVLAGSVFCNAANQTSLFLYRHQ